MIAGDHESIFHKPPARIIVGASDQNYPGWLHTQQGQLDITRWNDWLAVADPGTLTHILGEHVWEHLTIEESQLAARHCFAMLAPGGICRCAVPDGNFPNPQYQDMVKVGGPGRADQPAASHKVVYTWDTLTDVFETAGFDVRLLEWCDDDGVFHATEWDERNGFIYRSARFDHRNQAGSLGFVSLIVDAMKMPGHMTRATKTPNWMNHEMIRRRLCGYPPRSGPARL